MYKNLITCTQHNMNQRYITQYNQPHNWMILQYNTEQQIRTRHTREHYLTTCDTTQHLTLRNIIWWDMITYTMVIYKVIQIQHTKTQQIITRNIIEPDITTWQNKGTQHRNGTQYNRSHYAGNIHKTNK